MAVPITLIMPSRGLKYSIKAVVYGIDNQISMIEREYEKTSSLNLRILREEIGEGYSTRLGTEAIFAKMNFDKVTKTWSYVDKLVFSLQAPIYILYNSLTGTITVLKKLVR